MRWPLIGCLVGLVALIPDVASAKDEKVKFGKRGKGLGLGITAGGPSGASLKLFLHPRHALQVQLGYGLLHHGDGYASVDYLWHTPTVGDSPIVDASFYFGLGVGVGFWAKAGPGKLQAHDRKHPDGGAALLLRVPIGGIAFHWTEKPLDTAIEASWSPYVVLPDLRHFDVSLKVRYFF
jgi:hypothetical protein